MKMITGFSSSAAVRMIILMSCLSSYCENVTAQSQLSPTGQQDGQERQPSISDDLAKAAVTKDSSTKTKEAHKKHHKIHHHEKSKHKSNSSPSEMSSISVPENDDGKSSPLVGSDSQPVQLKSSTPDQSVSTDEDSSNQKGPAANPQGDDDKSEELKSNEPEKSSDAGSGESQQIQEPMSDYIITLKKDTTKAQMDEYAAQIIQNGGKIKQTYDSIILKGFAVSVKNSLVQTLDDNPIVRDVEPDGEVHIWSNFLKSYV